jgi:3-oxoadipate enol-lactonase
VLDALRRSGRVSLVFEEAGTVGIPVWLLHELGGSSASWREVIPLFAPDRRVIAVDFRCAGRSEKPIGSFELPISLTISLLCWRLLGVTASVDVIGAALGSLVGALLAISHPERAPVHNVRCRPRHGRADPWVCGRARRAGAGCRHARRSRKQAWRIRFRPITPGSGQPIARSGNDPAAYAELSLVLARLEMTASDWGAIRAPTLIVSGARDFLWPPEISRQVANLIPDAKYVTMEDAGHFPICRRPRH